MSAELSLTQTYFVVCNVSSTSITIIKLETELFRDNAAMNSLKIASLGSSFAAGPGIEPIINKVAGRSGENYPHLLATALKATLIDLTSSGATTENITSIPQRVGFRTLPPQLDGLPADADIVTITAGGNDLGYSMGMVWDTILARFPLLKLLFNEAEPKITPRELTQRCRTTIERVKARAPNAQIFIVRYLSVFKMARSGIDTPLSTARISYYKQQDEMIAKAWEDAAPDYEDVEIISAEPEQHSHSLGTHDLWVSGFSLKAMLWDGVIPYHPNREGHVAMAQVLIERIKREYILDSAGQ